jgi:hypothetical protein
MKPTSNVIELASLSETTPSNLVVPPRIDTTFSLVSSTAILLAIAAAIAACISAKEQQPAAKLRSLSGVKCHSCKYFHQNLYLNCTLHPSTVMTEQSVDCKDYCPNQQTQRITKWKQVIPFVRKIFPD